MVYKLTVYLEFRLVFFRSPQPGALDRPPPRARQRRRAPVGDPHGPADRFARAPAIRRAPPREIGRASCRERGSMWTSTVLSKNKQSTTRTQESYRNQSW